MSQHKSHDNGENATLRQQALEYEATCAAMRLAIEAYDKVLWHLNEQLCCRRRPAPDNDCSEFEQLRGQAGKLARAALSSTTGQELAEQMRKLEDVAKIARKFEAEPWDEITLADLNAALDKLDKKE